MMLRRGDVGTYSVPAARVETPNGMGTLIHYEATYDYRQERTMVRFGVVLDENPFTYLIAYYPPYHVDGYPPPPEARN